MTPEIDNNITPEWKLEVLREKWYHISYLVDANEEVYLVEREEERENWREKRFCWCYTSHWWFDGERFWEDEFWWDSICTIENWKDIQCEFQWNGKIIICSMIWNDFFSVEWNWVTVEDMVGRILAEKWGKLN